MSDAADFRPEDSIERLECLFRHAQTGTCVNGVAHDLNNHLGAVLAYAELVSLSKSLSPDDRNKLTEIIGAVGKCAALVSALTAIARKERPLASPANLDAVTEHALSLQMYDLRSARIAVERHYQDPVPSRTVDRPKLVRALLCLLTNAEEALERENEKKLRVSICEEGADAKIIVWNSGPAVPEPDRERIFEPLVSATEGDPFGLRLFYARKTAELHGGTLDYSPTEGFVLCLP